MTKTVKDIIATLTPDEIEVQTEQYRDKLRTVGVSFHHNSKLETLIQAWRDYEAAQVAATTGEKFDQSAANSLAIKREQSRKEHLRLIRVSITNHNPANAKREGEIFTVYTKYLGALKYHIPFNCDAANEYHLPKIVIENLKQRKFTTHVQKKTSDGKFVMVHQSKPEYSFVELEPLTAAELKKLARQQAIARGVIED